MLLADLTAGRRPSDRPEQFVADPELKQTAGDQDVAGAPAVVLAHTDVLRVDADNAVARHAPRDPLLAVALRRSSQLPGVVLATAKPALRGCILERLVRTLSVVVGHPLIEGLLCCLQGLEHLPGVELDTEGAVEALDLSGRGRRAGLCED